MRQKMFYCVLQFFSYSEQFTNNKQTFITDTQNTIRIIIIGLFTKHSQNFRNNTGITQHEF